MEAKQNSFSKDIIVKHFAIFGIGTFKTVKAENAPVRKRMLSALNEIDRELGYRHNKVVGEIDQREKDKLDTTELLLQSVRLANARGVLKRVKDQLLEALTRPEVSHLEETGDFARWTTEEFLEKAAEVYATNTTNFLNLHEAIAEQIAAYEAKIKTAPPARYSQQDYIPELFILTGGPFGTTPFHAVFSRIEVQELGQGNPVLAARTYCYQQLYLLKNFRLSDYLRAESEEQRQIVKDSILLLDNFIDQLEEVTVVRCCSLYSEATPKMNRPPHGISIEKISNSVVTETELRLEEFFRKLIIGSQEDTGLFNLAGKH